MSPGKPAGHEHRNVHRHARGRLRGHVCRRAQEAGLRNFWHAAADTISGAELGSDGRAFTDGLTN